MVFPPVFGPVITIVLSPASNLISFVTTIFASIKGWRAAKRVISLSVVNSGSVALFAAK